MNDDNTDSRFNRRFIAALTVLLVGFACGYVWMLTFGNVPKDNIRFADTALGFVLGTVLATPIAFWMGHSRSNTASPPAPRAPAGADTMNVTASVSTKEMES